jgi:hypothetical protein
VAVEDGEPGRRVILVPDGQQWEQQPAQHQGAGPLNRRPEHAGHQSKAALTPVQQVDQGPGVLLVGGRRAGDQIVERRVREVGQQPLAEAFGYPEAVRTGPGPEGLELGEQGSWPRDDPR